MVSHDIIVYPIYENVREKMKINKDKTAESPHSTPKRIRWNNILLAEVIAAKGDESFSSWVQGAAMDKLSGSKLQTKKSVKDE